MFSWIFGSNENDKMDVMTAKIKINIYEQMIREMRGKETRDALETAHDAICQYNKNWPAESTTSNISTRVCEFETKDFQNKKSLQLAQQEFVDSVQMDLCLKELPQELVAKMEYVFNHARKKNEVRYERIALSNAKGGTSFIQIGVIGADPQTIPGKILMTTALVFETRVEKIQFRLNKRDKAWTDKNILHSARFKLIDTLEDRIASEMNKIELGCQ